MKKKNLVVGLVMLLGMLMLTGCGKKPEDVVEKFCKGLKNYDYNAMNKCLENSYDSLQDELENDDDLQAFRTFMKDQANVIDYKIIDTQKSKGEAVVTVEFTFTDASQVIVDVMSDYIQQAMIMAMTGASDKEMEDLMRNLLEEKFEKGNLPRTTDTIEFYCTEVDGDWKISSVPYGLINVITCNIAETLESIGNLLY